MNLVQRRRTAGLGRVKDRRREYTSRNVHNYDKILVTKQNRVTEQHIYIAMTKFYVLSWIIGDGHRALTISDETRYRH